MSETVETTLALAKTLAEGFKAGAGTPAPSAAKKTSASPAWLPPVFPVAQKHDAGERTGPAPYPAAGR